ncbi:hypothetical protein SB6425_06297 [Klebsiella huaxiensis]|nr:hypothetical protein SB6425_06297 [Klebsiella huaxiensis]
MLKISFIITHDAVSLFFIGIEVQDLYRCTKNHPPVVRHFGDIDNLCIGQLSFNILNTAFAETLLLAGCVVLSVLFQIAMFARIGNSSDDFRTTNGLQKIQFFAKFFSTT